MFCCLHPEEEKSATSTNTGGKFFWFVKDGHTGFLLQHHFSKCWLKDIMGAETGRLSSLNPVTLTGPVMDQSGSLAAFLHVSVIDRRNDNHLFVRHLVVFVSEDQDEQNMEAGSGSHVSCVLMSDTRRCVTWRDTAVQQTTIINSNYCSVCSSAADLEPVTLVFVVNVVQRNSNMFLVGFTVILLHSWQLITWLMVTS